MRRVGSKGFVTALALPDHYLSMARVGAIRPHRTGDSELEYDVKLQTAGRRCSPNRSRSAFAGELWAVFAGIVGDLGIHPLTLRYIQTCT